MKAYLKDDPSAADSYRFAPGFARTMDDANKAFDVPLSDHAAISVDLPLVRPASPGTGSEAMGPSRWASWPFRFLRSLAWSDLLQLGGGASHIHLPIDPNGPSRVYWNLRAPL